MKLTVKSVAELRLPPDKTDITVWDDALPGFGIRLKPTSMAWRVQYRTANGQQRSESLGDVRKVTLEDARRIARRRFAQVELGEDPGADRVAAKRTVLAVSLTFGSIVTQYLETRRPQMAASTYRQNVRYLERYAQPLAAYPIGDITRAHIATLLREWSGKHGVMAANAARKILSTFFTWALREGLCGDANPVANTNTPGAGRPGRDRVLNDEELKIVWRVCNESDDDFARVIKLILYSACRREEVGGLLWPEVDLESGKLTLSASRVKNRRSHELILPEPALAILRAQPRDPERPWVFGKRGAGLTGWSYHKNRFDRLVAELAGRPLLQWSLHDLRRSVATRLADLGTVPHIIDAVLNHSKAPLHGTYVKATYGPEKRIALARWAEQLLAVVEGRDSKVVMLPQRA
jgi:integrase